MIYKTELVEKSETLLVRPYNTLKGKAGDVCVAIDLPTEFSSAALRAGVFCSGECFNQLTLDTQMMLALLQELLMALRAKDAYWYKSWLALGIEELGRDEAGEVESDWMVPLLVEEESDRLML